MTTDIKELRRLAKSAELGCLSHGNKRSFAELDAFHVAAHPSAVLDLIVHIEQQQIEIDTLRHGLRLANDARSDLEAKLSAQTAEPVAFRLSTGELSPNKKFFELMGFTDIQPLYTHPVKTELFKNWNTCPGCKAKWKELPENSPLMKAHRELEAREEAELQSGIKSISCRPNEQNAVIQTEQPSLSDALDIYEAQTKALPFGHEIRDRGYSAYNWQMAAIRDIRALLAQRQDSDKDATIAQLHALLRECLELEDNWPGIAYTADLKDRIDAAIANGASK